MTSPDTDVEATVDGGLDEPTELEPEQGALELAQPEDEHTRADWEKATAAVLRKARRMSEDDDDALVWDKLTRTTLDGIAVTPLGTPDLLDDLGAGERPTRQGAWDIRAHLGAGSAKQTNEDALVDLNGGVTSLWAAVDPDTDFATLLDGVFLDLAPVVLDATSDPVGTARSFLSCVGDLELHPATNLGVPAELATPELAAAARERGILAFVVDATGVHDRGASDAQELGWSMSAAAGYLRVLSAAGISVEEAAGLVEFRYAVTDEQFPGIAKLRAARQLWARVLELSEVSPGSMSQRQHAVTSKPMMSRYDPYVNMLRTTVAAFAAGVGGADSVTVLPFDSPLGKPETLGRRIARNTSALLISESHLAKVADPAGGSYAVEKLTADLAGAAWEVLGNLESGADLDAAIAEVAAVRDQQVATRKRPLTGLTEFPNLAEELPERTPDGAFDDVRPYGAAFEELRDAPPAGHVFLATLGTIASHTARATFATNLFAAGGVAVDVAGATDGVDALLAAYDGQAVACLAGADATYAEWGEAASAALREAGATRVIIAGKPADHTDDACAMGVDALAFLIRTREALQ
ncbi:methylmalonyl-CoA mutase family protein [soil metagenome]